MSTPDPFRAIVFVCGLVAGGLLLAPALVLPQRARDRGAARPSKAPRPGGRGHQAQPVPADRPEQKMTEHDKSDVFDPKKPAPLTPALKDQPKEGRITGLRLRPRPAQRRQAVHDRSRR